MDWCDEATGQCKHQPVDCDDGDPCTMDYCDPTTEECKHEPINCDDGDPCTMDYCDKKTGKCVNRPIAGCDNPDENYDISTSNITLRSHRTLSGAPDPEKESSVAVLQVGDAYSTQNLLSSFAEAPVFVDIDFFPDLVNDLSVLVIPTGGLYGLDSLPSFKSNLEQYVRDGGTLIVFSQQHGYEYSALPGGNLSGFGWLEDQSCHHSSVYIDTYHPILSGQDSVILDVVVDGYFTRWPEDATILLSRTKNGMPAMLMYKYGNGTVIASTIYEDWAYTHHQSTQDGKNLVRDMIAWAKNGRWIPEYGRTDTVEIAIKVMNKNIPIPAGGFPAPRGGYPQYDPGDIVDISINITNYANQSSDKVVLSLFDPDYELIKEINTSLSIQSEETKTIRGDKNS